MADTPLERFRHLVDSYDGGEPVVIHQGAKFIESVRWLIKAYEEKLAASLIVGEIVALIPLGQTLAKTQTAGEFIAYVKDKFAKAEKAEADLAAAREEIERLREVLTPSAETKAAYMGEFKFSVRDGYDEFDNEIYRDAQVPWTTIKEIMGAIHNRAALAQGAEGDMENKP